MEDMCEVEMTLVRHSNDDNRIEWESYCIVYAILKCM